MRRVLLDIDLGEWPDEPEDLWRFADVANVACGGHAGDDASMRLAIDRCTRHGAAVGAHPSYVDRAGFGRARLDVPPQEVRAFVREQCGRLAAIARETGAIVRFAKAHGALYHAAGEDAAIARAVVQGVVDALGGDVTLIGPACGAMREEAERVRVAYAREAFADRGTRADGTLLPRGDPGALVTDPAAAAANASRLDARGDVDVVCVHGDTPGAIEIARAVRAALDAQGGT